MGLLKSNIGDAESILLYGILIGIWIRGTWEIYLLSRQRKVIYGATVVPKVLVGILPYDLFLITKLYYLEAIFYLILYTLLDLIAKSMVVVFDGISIFWIFSIGVAKAFAIQSDREIIISIFFMVIVHTVQTLYMITFKIYFQFAFENRYNLQKKTFAFFLITSIISYLLKIIGILIYVPALLFTFRATGQYFFLILWLVRLIFILIVNFIFMDFIFPTMSQFTPLENGKLKDSIQAIATRVGFPLTQIYVYKASETSSERNAFLYGFFGGKIIVLYDTLIASLSIEEIVAVVAHELGHWKGNHTVKLRLFIEIYYTIILAAAYFVFPLNIIYRAFNFRDSKPIMIGLIIIIDFIFIPWDYVFASISTILTRHFEYKADAFAVKFGQGKHLRSSLIHLHKYNVDFPINDWLFSTFNYTHPTLLERLDKLPDEEQ